MKEQNEAYERLLSRRTELEAEMLPLATAMQPLREEWETVHLQIKELFVPGSHWLDEPIQWDQLKGRVVQQVKRLARDEPEVYRTYRGLIELSGQELKTFYYWTDKQVEALQEHLKSLGLRLRA